MSMWYADPVLLTLNETVCPAFTLIDVAKPWSVESPAPLTCQSAAGSPARVFSHATGLTTGGPQGPAAAAGGAADRATALASAKTSTDTASIAIRRLEAGTPLTRANAALDRLTIIGLPPNSPHARVSGELD